MFYSARTDATDRAHSVFLVLWSKAVHLQHRRDFDILYGAAHAGIAALTCDQAGMQIALHKEASGSSAPLEPVQPSTKSLRRTKCLRACVTRCSC
eukprot:3920352-Amphidinium_carterae.2